MQHNAHIVIGSKLGSIFGRFGEFAVLFMNATLTFDNGTDAINAYNSIEGEAYIWDISTGSDPVLLEAKLKPPFFLQPINLS